MSQFSIDYSTGLILQSVYFCMKQRSSSVSYLIHQLKSLLVCLPPSPPLSPIHPSIRRDIFVHGFLLYGFSSLSIQPSVWRVIFEPFINSPSFDPFGELFSSRPFNPIRPGLFSRSPGPGGRGLRGPDG